MQAAVTDDRAPTVELLVPTSPAIDMLAGLKSTYGRRHLRRLEHESLVTNAQVETISVPSVTLDNLIKQFELHHVDVLMVDVEGAELRVLASADWDTFRPTAILLESNYGSRAPVNFLRAHGYQLLARIGWDRVFVASDIIQRRASSTPLSKLPMQDWDP